MTINEHELHFYNVYYNNYYFFFISIHKDLQKLVCVHDVILLASSSNTNATSSKLPHININMKYVHQCVSHPPSTQPPLSFSVSNFPISQPKQADAREEIPHYVIPKATHWRQMLLVSSSAQCAARKISTTQAFAGERHKSGRFVQ